MQSSHSSAQYPQGTSRTRSSCMCGALVPSHPLEHFYQHLEVAHHISERTMNDLFRRREGWRCIWPRCGMTIDAVLQRVHQHLSTHFAPATGTSQAFVAQPPLDPSALQAQRRAGYGAPQRDPVLAALPAMGVDPLGKPVPVGGGPGQAQARAMGSASGYGQSQAGAHARAPSQVPQAGPVQGQIQAHARIPSSTPTASAVPATAPARTAPNPYPATRSQTQRRS